MCRAACPVPVRLQRAARRRVSTAQRLPQGKHVRPAYALSWSVLRFTTGEPKQQAWLLRWLAAAPPGANCCAAATRPRAGQGSHIFRMCSRRWPTRDRDSVALQVSQVPPQWDAWHCIPHACCPDRKDARAGAAATRGLGGNSRRHACLRCFFCALPECASSIWRTSGRLTLVPSPTKLHLQ